MGMGCRMEKTMKDIEYMPKFATILEILPLEMVFLRIHFFKKQWPLKLVFF